MIGRRSSAIVASGAGIGEAQDLGAQRQAGQLRAALPLTNVWREALVLPASRVRSVSPATSPIVRDRHAQRVGGDLQHDGVGALADIDRAGEQRDAAVARSGPSPSRTGWTGWCCRCRTTCRRCRRRARRCAGAAGVERRGLCRSACQCGRSASRHSGSAAPCAEHLAGGGRAADAQRVAVAELQRVEAEPVGQHVHQRLAGDGGLRHAEAAKGAGGRPVGVDRRAWCNARSAPRTGPWRAPARGWRRSVPSTHRRRCRSRRGSGTRSAGRPRSAAAAAVMRAGWRLVVAAMLSGRV